MQQHTPVSAIKPAAPVGVVHLALAVGGFAIGTAEFAAMSLEPDLARGLGVDAPAVGHLISAYALGVVVGAPTLAVALAKLPRRTSLIVLMLMFAVGNALSAFAPGYDTMLLFRFLAGLPHGAYFGIAALVAASLMPERRTTAIGRVMLGLTVATIVGVPLAKLLGQWLSWRYVFGVVAGLALVTAALVATFAPHDRPERDASPLRELAALRNGQVWLTLAIGAIGFGGLFAVYTYLASTLTEVTGASNAVVPLVLAVFGAGLTAGNLFVPRFADRALMPTAGVLLVWAAVVLALYPWASGNLVAITAVVFAIGCGGALATVLQTRLMDVAGDAQGLAAALNHSAFNVANAIGPWAGGLAIAGGYGWASTGYVGSALALAGLVIWALTLVADRHVARRRAALA